MLYRIRWFLVLVLFILMVLFDIEVIMFDG